MSQTAHFRFYGSLNDFLRPGQRNTDICYTYALHQSLKDMVEALGIPHLEVREVLVDGRPVSLSTKLKQDARVAVCPFDGHESELLAGIPERRFVLDVHLGTLARNLRLLGFDTVYGQQLEDAALVKIAHVEQRILLTRDVNLLKHKAIPVGYWLRSQHTEEQVAEVVHRFRLAGHIRPFTRCMVCNGTIEAVAKEAVVDQLPPKTQLYFDEFYQCTSCRRVFWKGSHYQRMKDLVRCISKLP